MPLPVADHPLTAEEVRERFGGIIAAGIREMSQDLTYLCEMVEATEQGKANLRAAGVLGVEERSLPTLPPETRSPQGEELDATIWPLLGAGELTVTEIAERLGLKRPSVYLSRQWWRRAGCPILELPPEPLTGEERREEVRRLHGEGHKPADIARTVGMSTFGVHKVLDRDGLQRRRGDWGEARARDPIIWPLLEQGVTQSEIAKSTGYTLNEIKGSRLRRKKSLK